MNNEQEEFEFRAKPHKLSNIAHIVAVVSGKGGVGKSLVTSMLASSMQKKGYRCAILDADITGPSIPKAFGLSKKATGQEGSIMPEITGSGIKVISINMLLEDEGQAVVWRGPLIANAVKMFYTDVVWGELDYLFVDMPPGTGDVPLTVFQSLPVDGIVMVTSPQELVSMIVSKAVNMAQLMNIPILGLVENLSYFLCPDNNKEYQVFGESHIEAIAEKHNLEVLAKMPIDPKISEACDRGLIEKYDVPHLEGVTKKLENLE
jgi:Mrp family chromosome partitioning ATPase